jgi:hypothetical protein
MDAAPGALLMRAQALARGYRSDSTARVYVIPPDWFAGPAARSAGNDADGLLDEQAADTVVCGEIHVGTNRYPSRHVREMLGEALRASS